MSAEALNFQSAHNAGVSCNSVKTQYRVVLFDGKQVQSVSRKGWGLACKASRSLSG